MKTKVLIKPKIKSSDSKFKKIFAYLWWLIWYDPLTARFILGFKKLFKKLKQDRKWQWGGIITVVFVLVLVGFFPFGAQAVPNFVLDGLLEIFTMANTVVATLVGWIGSAFAYVVKGPADGSTGAFQTIIGNAAVTAGWDAVRDVANMAFVLILLAIGFATILRVPSYHVKKLIVPFVVALLLINFSKLICGVITDFANVLMASFANAMGGDNPAGAIADALDISTLREAFSGRLSGGELGDQVKKSIISFFFLLALGGSMFLIVLLLISRWISLIVLVIFSPLVYAGMVIPATKSMVGKWWSQFMQRALYGPVAVFMVWLAIIIVTNLGGDLTGKGYGKWQYFVTLVVAVIVLFKAVTVSRNMGIAGAGAVTGLAKSAAKGLGKATLRKVGDKTGFNDWRTRRKAQKDTRQQIREDAQKEVGRQKALSKKPKGANKDLQQKRLDAMKEAEKRNKEEEVAKSMNSANMDSKDLQNKMKTGSAQESLESATALAARGELDSGNFSRIYNDPALSQAGKSKLASEMAKTNPDTYLKEVMGGDSMDPEKRKSQLQRLVGKSDIKNFSPEAMQNKDVLEAALKTKGAGAVNDAVNLMPESDQGAVKKNISNLAKGADKWKDDAARGGIHQANLVSNKSVSGNISEGDMKSLVSRSKSADLGKAWDGNNFAGDSEGLFVQSVSQKKIKDMQDNIGDGRYTDLVKAKYDSYKSAGDKDQMQRMKDDISFSSILESHDPTPKPENEDKDKGKGKGNTGSGSGLVDQFGRPV